MDHILEKVTENVKVTRALSATLIGKVNGDSYDDAGGVVGRLEKRVREIEVWRWWLTASYITTLLAVVGYFVKQYLEKHP